MIQLCLFLFLAANACGNVLPFNGKILNGSTATSGQFPYQASLRVKPNQHFCGGSIINAYTILTAAHCTYMRDAKNIIVVVGTTKLVELAQVHEVNEIINHEDWNPNKIANDIALVKLKRPIALSDNVQTIKLETNEIVDGTTSVVSGWGLTSINGEHAENLQYLHSTIINHVECKRRQTPENADRVKSFNICGFNDFGYGVCNEDSGGPLAVDGKLVGVVSWSDECGGGTGDVYSKVSYYVDWINANL